MSSADATPFVAWTGRVRALGTKGRLGLAAGACAAIAILVGLATSFGNRPPAPVGGKGDIVARGRIEPQGRVQAISGPAGTGLIEKLQVDEGDTVRAGQVLAVLDGYESRKADYEMAEATLQLAELQRAQVNAGAKQAEIAAQRDVVEAKRAQLELTQKQWDRHSSQDLSDAVSKESLDTLKTQLDQAKADLAAAENTLKSLTEVRAVDDKVAAEQIAVQKAAAARAKAEMERLLIRAPHDGTILSLQARAGEMIGADGVLRMGDLAHLIVVAEIDESEAAQVKDGMEGTIDGTMLGQPVKAKVTWAAHEVFRQKRPASDILIGRDARIVEVELTPATPLPAVVGGEVVVRLLPAASGKS
jgi:HlyD family secretion protein